MKKLTWQDWEIIKEGAIQAESSLIRQIEVNDLILARAAVKCKEYERKAPKQSKKKPA